MVNLFDFRLLLLIALIAMGWLLVELQAVMMPFFLGALLGYLGDPLVDRLEKRGFSRTAGVSVVFLGLGFVAMISVMILVPMLVKQVSYLHAKVPLFLSWLSDTVLPWIQTKLASLGVEIDLEVLSWQGIEAQLKEGATQVNWGATGDILKPVVAQISHSGLALIGFIGNLALVPVVGFYLVRDWDILVAKLGDLLPRGIEPTIAKLAKECDEVLGAFLKGQLLVMLALGMIYTIGLWIVGLDLALLIGMVAGLGSLVPYLGFALGIVSALIASIFQFGDWFHPGMVIVVFVIGQALEGMILTPILVGDRIGLHPVAVIFSVLAGAQLFGFVGMLLALPVAAVILVLLRHIHEIYVASHFYETGPVIDNGVLVKGKEANAEAEADGMAAQVEVGNINPLDGATTSDESNREGGAPPNADNDR